MSLVDQLAAFARPDDEDESRGRTLAYYAPGTKPADGNALGNVWGKKAPGESADLDRILAIPRRPRPSDAELEAMVELMGRRLRLPERAGCACRAEHGRDCIRRLKPAQAWALYEMGISRGLLGPIVVGGGKTALNILAPMVVPDCCTAVLLVPPKLVEQLKAEYLLWAEHWRVPSLVFRKWASIQPGRPAVHVVPLSQLSRPNAAVLLESLAPDLIIIDEAHKFRYATSTRTSRFLRYMVAHPETRLCCWSGSLTSKSIRDYAHLSGLSLGSRSPVPIDPETLSDWATAIDPPKPGEAPGPMGMLSKLCEVGETARDGFKRRLLETRGVVATNHAGIGAGLSVHARDPGPIPDSVDRAMKQVRATFQRPDGEELVDAFQVARCARELACGFFYRWKFPRGEPRELIEEWIGVRKSWHKEVREKLAEHCEYLDQPILLARAAMRYYDPEYDGDMPTWRSAWWPAWVEIRDAVKPESEAVWVDDYLARDAADWGVRNRGVVWYEHVAFGRRVAELSGLPMHGGGPDAEQRIKAEDGSRSIVASIRSHGEGRDGLQMLFDRQLVANPPVSRATGGADRWEQLLGRLHREGQTAGEIHTDLYRHTWEMRESWDRALEHARYVTDTMGSFQKLLACAPTW